MQYKKHILSNFLELIKPIWYFNLLQKSVDDRLWIQYYAMTNKEKQMVEFDANYSNRLLSELDIFFQALNRGFVNFDNYNIDKKELVIFPIDIYRFLRKYYSSIWIYIVLVQRLIYFNNPLKEIFAVIKTKKVKKVNLFNKFYKYKNYKNFQSELINSNPLVSIIIPTYNRYHCLLDLLKDLELQCYSNFEIIVIDQSNPYNKDFYSQTDLKIRLLRQNSPGLWEARNNGIRNSNSDYLLFLDDDSRINDNWIYEHLKCLDFFKADISSGVSLSEVGAKVPGNYSFFRLSDQLDTGNVIIKKKVFKDCGLFDKKFEKMRMGDAEFGLRSYLNGFINISNPKALRKHLKTKIGGLRDMGHWDAFRPKNILAPRPIPSVLYYYRKYWGDKSAIINCALILPFSLLPYKYKSFKWSMLLSVILFFSLLPIILVLFLISWRKSSNILHSPNQLELL